MKKKERKKKQQQALYFIGSHVCSELAAWGLPFVCQPAFSALEISDAGNVPEATVISVLFSAKSFP